MRIQTALPSALVAAFALAVTPVADAAKPQAGTWTGKLDKYTSVKVKFKVSKSGRVMTDFSAKGVPVFCAFSETIENSTIFIPSAKISRSGSVNKTYETDKYENKLKGKFTSPTKFKGNIYQAGGGCGGGYDFKATRR